MHSGAKGTVSCIAVGHASVVLFRINCTRLCFSEKLLLLLVFASLKLYSCVIAADPCNDIMSEGVMIKKEINGESGLNTWSSANRVLTYLLSIFSIYWNSYTTHGDNHQPENPLSACLQEFILSFISSSSFISNKTNLCVVALARHGRRYAAQESALLSLLEKAPGHRNRLLCRVCADHNRSFSCLQSEQQRWWFR